MINNESPSDPRRNRRRLHPRKLLGGVALLLVSWTVVAALGARWLVVRVPLEKCDAIVVLSGSRAYKERTAYAAALYRNGVAPLILLTNDGEQGSWSNAEERNPYFHELAARELERNGVPAAAIRLLPTQVQGTVDEAIVTKQFADQNTVSTLLLVTSGYHSRRSIWVFDKAFAGSGVRLGVQSPESDRDLYFWWLRPQGWKTIGAEYVKMVYYRMTV